MARPLLAAGSVSAYLDDDERLANELHAVEGAVEREIDGSVSTLSPAGSHGWVLAVTTRRVLLAIGGGERGGEDALTTIPFPDVEAVRVSDGLLRSRFAIETTDGETYSCSPEEGNMQAAATAIRQRAEKCERIRSLLEKAELNSASVDLDPDLATADIESDTTESTLTRALALLSDLAVEDPRGLGALRERLERLWLGNYVERGDRLQERGMADAPDDEESAREDLEAALRSYQAALDIAVEREFSRTDELRDRRDALGAELSTLRTDPAAKAEEALETARSATGEAATEAWLKAYEAYGQAVQADWVDLPTDVEDEQAALRYQRAWVARQAVDALRSSATTVLESTEAQPAPTEEARTSYERGDAMLERALEIADEQPIGAERLHELRTEVQEQIQLTEWEWGREY